MRALLERDEIDEEVFAEWLEFPKHTVLSVLSADSRVTYRLANRLAEKLGPEASFWLEMQKRFDQNNPHKESPELQDEEFDGDTTEPSDNA